MKFTAPIAACLGLFGAHSPGVQADVASIVHGHNIHEDISTNEVSLRGNDASGSDPFSFQAAQELLASFGGEPAAGGAGEAVRELLLTGKANPTSLTGLTSQIKGMVENLFKDVTKSHDGNKDELAKAITGFNLCRGAKWRTSAGVTDTGSQGVARHIWRAKREQARCRAQLSPFAKAVKSCSARVKVLLETKNELCKELFTYEKMPKNLASTCTVSAAGETNLQWVRRLGLYVQKQRSIFRKFERKCDKGIRRFKGPNRACNKRKRALKAKKYHCETKLAAKVAEHTCNLRMLLSSKCSTYSGCFASQLKVYRHLENRTTYDVATRKLQYRMLTRISCLTGAYDFQASKVDKSKLDACIGALVASTEHLNITAPAVPRRAPCTGELPAGLEIPGIKCAKSRSLGLAAENASVVPAAL